VDEKIAIYQLNLQSADKLDERRDATIRAYGGICVVLTTAAFGKLERLPSLSVVLWALLVVVALAWLSTLRSLTAKLTAKNLMLVEMEDDKEVPTAFLTRERKHWEDHGTPTLFKALQRSPWAFLVLGGGGLLGTLAYVVWTSLCSCR